MTPLGAHYREYETRDKTAWGRGPWSSEPDKAQWVDGATDLDCLIVRNRLGALCGYVGVGATHPWHGVEYHGCVETPVCGERYCGHTPEGKVDIHGGLTFSDRCHEPTIEDFEALRARLTSAEADVERARYPHGDAAEDWALFSPYLSDYRAWAEHAQATQICHLAAPGRPEPVWWFGFDCGHYLDLVPGMREFRALAGTSALYEGAIYRDFGYVAAEVGRLAEQIAAVAPSPSRALALDGLWK